MIFFFRKKIFILSILLKLILLARINQVLCHNCDCKPNLCCNRYGYCGSGNEYCGRGCQGGPCFNSHVSVTDIVTDAFFNGFAYHLRGSCNEGFYTHESFFEAIKSYPKLGMVGTKNDSRREIAAFFAHFTHDAIGMCNRVQLNVGSPSCPRNNLGSPCNPNGGSYWPSPSSLQKQNYGLPSQNTNIEGVKRDPVVMFNTTMKFWMKNCHDAIISGHGFGATIHAINGKVECNGENPSSVSARIQYYTDYCKQLQVDPGTKLRC